jgi:hypothetical protein
MRDLNLNHLVAVLALVLAVSAYLATRKLQFPDKICMGAALLALLMVATFWTAVQINLGNEDEDD